MGNVCCGTNENSKPDAFESNNDDDYLYRTDQQLRNDAPTSPLDPSEAKDDTEAIHSAGGATGDIASGSLYDANQAHAEAERQRDLQEEQARLALIVSTAGRDMISLSSRSGGLGNSGSNLVGSMGGNVGGSSGGFYYDPAYAATVAQDLLHGVSHAPEGKGLLSLARDIESNNQMRDAMSSIVDGGVPTSQTCIEDGMGAVEVLSLKIDYSEDLKATSMSQQGTSGPSHALGARPIIAGGSGGSLEEMDFFLESVAEKFLSSASFTKERLFQGIGPIVENLP